MLGKTACIASILTLSLVGFAFAGPPTDNASQSDFDNESSGGSPVLSGAGEEDRLALVKGEDRSDGEEDLLGRIKLIGEDDWERYSVAQAGAADGTTGEAPEGGYEDKSGTDPRDFAPKFMPYYRYTKLENDLEVHELTLFGLQDFFDGKIAITYELPTIKNVQWDASDSPPVIPSDIDDTGLGDLILRVFAPLGKEKFLGMSWMYGAQFTVPTHTDDSLGNDRLTGGPLLVNIWDLDFLPMPGAFLAMMHITEFTLWDDDDADDSTKYIGRYFMMIPLVQKYKIYTLPEVQFIYDFENDDASLWFGPEFGKMWKWGTSYIKPGFGIDNDQPTDRDFSFEVGIRYFFGWKKG